MFSIVCPTMWRAKELATMIPHLLDSPLVGEFILIDNASDIRPVGANKMLDNPKVRIIDPKTNIFVNPAWNLGVKEATYEKICLLSDDVVFHSNTLVQLNKQIKSERGIFGPTPNSAKDLIQPNKRITLFPTRDKLPVVGFGCLMFFHKEAYHPIPDELKIFFGDNWIFAYNSVKRRVQNCYIDMDIAVRWRITSQSKEFDEQHHAEHDVVEEIFDREFGKGIYRIKDECERNGLTLDERNVR